MKDYLNMPPARSFIRVLKSCPRAAVLYIDLWKQRSLITHTVRVKKRDIRKEYLISPTIYRNELASLAYLNLVSFVETDEEYQIDVMGSCSDE